MIIIIIIIHNLDRGLYLEGWWGKRLLKTKQNYDDKQKKVGWVCNDLPIKVYI